MNNVKKILRAMRKYLLKRIKAGKINILFSPSSK
jgi:hypothetical protein